MNRVDAAKNKDRSNHPFHYMNDKLKIEAVLEQQDMLMQNTGKIVRGEQDDRTWAQMIFDELS